MRKIKVQPLTKEAFAPFGQYYDMVNPDGYALKGEIHRFFPDRIVAAQGLNVAYSPLLVKKPESMVIKQVNYYFDTSRFTLKASDIGLRVRMMDKDHYIITLKKKVVI